MMLSAIAAPVGQTHLDNIVVAAAWIGILALALLILIVSARTTRMMR
jgi:hypothetical protein